MMDTQLTKRVGTKLVQDVDALLRSKLLFCLIISVSIKIARVQQENCTIHDCKQIYASKITVPWNLIYISIMIYQLFLMLLLCLLKCHQFYRAAFKMSIIGHEKVRQLFNYIFQMLERNWQGSHINGVIAYYMLPNRFVRSSRYLDSIYQYLFYAGVSFRKKALH